MEMIGRVMVHLKNKHYFRRFYLQCKECKKCKLKIMRHP